MGQKAFKNQFIETIFLYWFDILRESIIWSLKKLAIKWLTFEWPNDTANACFIWSKNMLILLHNCCNIKCLQNYWGLLTLPLVMVKKCLEDDSPKIRTQSTLRKHGQYRIIDKKLFYTIPLGDDYLFIVIFKKWGFEKNHFLQATRKSH